MTVSDWRKVKVSQAYPLGDTNYCNNTIVTSRYTVFTFLPKVLFILFRRVANFFFLSLIIVQLTLEVPTDPSAYTTAFAVIVFVNLIKQGYEDYLRHKADEGVNRRKITVLDPDPGQAIKTVKSQNLRVGQIVLLMENDSVPADLLLLSCADESGNAVSKCDITTANLDGEPNKKVRFCPSTMPSFTSPTDLASFLKREVVVVEYDQPNADLYKFNGLLSISGGKTVPISNDNILLRGTTLKSCSFVFGCIVYAGKDTKLSYNSVPKKRTKFSGVETSSNRMTYLMFGVLLVLCSIATGLYFWQESTISIGNAWYIPLDEDPTAWEGLITFLLFLVLLSYIIPVSLAVTIELVKFFGSMFFGWDNDMRCEKRGIRALCNTSDLNEELGQIDFLLTDKTGTLTENNLKFAATSIAGTVYDVTEMPEVKSQPAVQEFLEAMALCHTVQQVEHEQVVSYHGASPDEEILVATAHELGVTFIGDIGSEHMIVQTSDARKVFKRHLVLDFDADRKAMSVIVEDEAGRILMLTKGAESTLLLKCQEHTDLVTWKQSSEHVTKFAEKGLRTLVFAKKEMDRADLNRILEEVEDLRRTPEQLQSYYKDVECDLELLGVTAVEDELQENVHETLMLLQKAGIRIWMLTGDKLETAVNIAKTCGLVPNHSSIVELAQFKDSDVKDLEQNLTNLQNSQFASNQTLVIDGPTFAVGFEHCRLLLAALCMASSQVVFCRMAPLQKAQVVKLIHSNKVRERKQCVCAVGDGGNDVAMIQEAHIGIGIIGREGSQAARSSDFAVPNFKSLKKAILVHGHWYYYRTAVLVAYFYYRGVLFVLPQLLYGIVSGFSGQTVYDALYMTCFSLFYTALPILFFGILEQHKSPQELFDHPELYKRNSGNALLSWRSAGVWWSMMTAWHLFLVCVFPVLVWPAQFEVMDWGMMSLFLGSVMAAVSNFKVLMDTVYLTWIIVLGQVISFLQLAFINTLVSEIVKSPIAEETRFVYFPMLVQPDFWFMTLLITALGILPDLIYGGIRRHRILEERRSLRKDDKAFKTLP